MQVICHESGWGEILWLLFLIVLNLLQVCIDFHWMNFSLVDQTVNLFVPVMCKFANLIHSNKIVAPNYFQMVKFLCKFARSVMVICKFATSFNIHSRFCIAFFHVSIYLQVCWNTLLWSASMLTTFTTRTRMVFLCPVLLWYHWDLRVCIYVLLVSSIYLHETLVEGSRFCHWPFSTNFDLQVCKSMSLVGCFLSSN